MPLKLLADAPYSPPPDHRAVADFIRRRNAQFGGALSRRFGYSRVVALCDFERRTLPILKAANITRIAIVGGSPKEPELMLLGATGAEVAYLNYDEDAKFDLGLPWDASYGNFDLVICNQVLEHVFDALLAMRNLRAITKPGGFLYVTIPVVCKIHGLPHFYSAGYYPMWLRKAFEASGLTPEFISFWGSRKFTWDLSTPTYRQLAPGFHWWMDFVDLRRPFVDGRRFSNLDRYISDAWGLARRPPQ